VSRGDIFTAARGGDTGKPRPVVIIQDDRFDATASVTVCPLTTTPTDAPLTRIPLGPSPLNGLEHPSRLMVDKVTTGPRDSLRDQLGRLPEFDPDRLNRALLVFLGLAD
jgi:mRNA interferase MazF